MRFRSSRVCFTVIGDNKKWARNRPHYGLRYITKICTRKCARPGLENQVAGRWRLFNRMSKGLCLIYVHILRPLRLLTRSQKRVCSFKCTRVIIIRHLQLRGVFAVARSIFHWRRKGKLKKNSIITYYYRTLRSYQTLWWRPRMDNVLRSRRRSSDVR